MTAPAARWPWLDVVGTLAMQSRWWELVVEDRPTAIEAVDEPARTAAAALAEGLVGLDVDPGDPESDPAATVAARSRVLLGALGGGRRPAAPPTEARAVIDRTTDALVAAMAEAGRAAVAAHPPDSPAGRVVRVASSSGGVPKVEVAEVWVTEEGLAGDEQADRLDHGRPWQALCLWSAEVIQALVAEGHPISPGSCGENLLLAGVDWTEVRPGVQLQLGDDVVVEVSGPANPCRTIAGSFIGGRFERISHARHPGWSRLYAWVRTEGVVRLDDRVVVS